MLKPDRVHRLIFFLLLFLSGALLHAADAGSDTDIFTLAGDLKGSLIWDARSETGEVRAGSATYVFKVGVPYAVADSSEKLGSGNVYMKDDMLMVSRSLADAVRKHFDSVSAAVSKNRESGHEQTRESLADTSAAISKNRESGHRVAAIFIDPGHGGKDPGAIGTHRIGGKNVRVMEKTVVLNIGKKLRDMLAEEYPDKKIIMSRSGDTFPSLEDRVRMANKNKEKLKPNESILFISIHANASLNKKANGFEVWCLPEEYKVRKVVDENSVDDSSNMTLMTALNTIAEEEFSRESILLSRHILNGMDRKISKEIPSRGIKRESWFVVSNAKMPSVLIEVGFVSNPKEAGLLNSDSYLKKISEGIYNGVKGFVHEFEHSE